MELILQPLRDLGKTVMGIQAGGLLFGPGKPNLDHKCNKNSLFTSPMTYF